MESNSDKEMRDKLRGVEPAFDPKAWEQMEAMLEKDRKPLGLIWWWTGGVAVALLLGLSIWGYQQTTSNKTTVAEPQHVIAVNGNNALIGTGTSPSKTEINSQTAAADQTNTSSQNAVNKPGQFKANYNQQAPVRASATTTSVKPVNTKNSKTIAEAINRTNSNHGNVKKHTTKASAALNVSNEEKSNKADESQTKNSAQAISGMGQLNVPGLEEGLASFVTERTKQELFEMFLMRIGALTSKEEDATSDMIKKDDRDVDLKKLKKKVLFNYSLGIAANVTGSTLGKQDKGTSLFYAMPSYMIGVTEDFLFFKRFTITNGFMFSQTSFAIGYPQYVTSNITEFDMPIGVKGYVISKPKVRFYMGAGIINHIKLKEIFTSAQSNNIAMNSLGAPGAFTFSNSFTDQSQSANSSYSINNAKRYYASFYASAGTEFIVKNRVVFFTEPLFYMSLEKVGVLDKHKYNLGLNAGIRYQFK